MIQFTVISLLLQERLLLLRLNIIALALICLFSALVIKFAS